MNESLYRANLLDHYEQPRHYGTLPQYTHTVEGANLSCGDEIILFAQIDDGIITDASFTARACVICTASTSMLLEAVVGQPLNKAVATTTDQIRENLGIELSPVRLKCALLPLETLKTLTTAAPIPAV